MSTSRQFHSSLSFASLADLLDENTLQKSPPALENPLPLRSMPFVAKGSPLRDTRVIRSGFSWLQNSIMTCVDRLPEAPLDEKFAVLSRWIDSYHINVIPQKLADELDSILSLAKDDEGPNVKRCLVSTFALCQLMLVLKKVKPVLADVADCALRGIVDHIFANPPASLPSILLDGTITKDVMMQQTASFQTRMYFQDARERKKKLDAVNRFVTQWETSQKNCWSVLQTAVKKWSSFSVRCCFNQWKSEVQTGKIQRGHLDEVAHLKQQHAELQKLIAENEKTATLMTTSLEEARLATAHLNNRWKLQCDALRCDVVLLEEKNTNLQQELDSVKSSFHSQQELSSHELRTTRSTVNAFTELATSLHANYFQQRGCLLMDVRWPSNASQDAADQAVVIMALSICGVSEPGVNPVQQLCGAPMLNLAAAMLQKMFPDTFSLELLETQISPSDAVEKAIMLVNWCGRVHLPLPHELLRVDVLASGDANIGRILLGTIVNAAMFPADFSTVAPDCAALPLLSVPPHEATIANGSLATLCDTLRTFGDKISPLRKAVADYVFTSTFQSRLMVTNEPCSTETPEWSQFCPEDSFLQVVATTEYRVPILHSLIQGNFFLIRQCYLSYCGSDSLSSASSMPHSSFVKLLHDVHYGELGVLDSSTVKDLIANNAITPRIFVQLLIQAASRRHPLLGAAEAFRLLVVAIQRLGNVSSMSQSLDATRYFEPFAGKLEGIKADLLKIFRRACTEGSLNKMGCSEFLKFAQETKTIDEHFTVGEAQTVFAAIKPGKDLMIDFDMFVSLLCAVGIMRVKAPWIPYPLRCSRYIFDVVLVQMSRKCGLQYVAAL